MICRDLDIDRALQSRQRQLALIEGRAPRLSDFIINSYANGPSGGDPYWASVAALLHMDGPNSSTSFPDETGKTWTRTNVIVSTTQSKYGGASGLWGGSGTWTLTTGSSADLGFGSGDYTVEGYHWISPTTTTTRCLFDNTSATDTGIRIYASINSANLTNRLSANSNTANIAGTGSTQWTGATWQHWAVTRDSGTLRGFLAGNLVWTVTDTRTYASSAAAWIGSAYNASGPADCYIDEVRITKGVARYVASFTPPSAAFPNY